jgi:hypothetical protein
VLVTHASSVPDAVEEFEDVDGDLAPAADLVAQGRGASGAVARAQSMATRAARSATADAAK